MGGVSTISVENFLSYSAEKIRRATLYSVTNFGYRKIFYSIGLCHDVPAKVLCLTVPKHFVEGNFYAVFQKPSGSEKLYGKEGGGNTKVSFENFFVSQCQKKPLGNALVFH